MKTLAFCWVYLLCIFSSASSYAEQFVLWSKLEVAAELPLPYGETSVAFLTDTSVVSQVEMSNSVGHWVFTHPELHHIPINVLTYKGVIPLKKDCAEFQQHCISFGWFAGEPRYITFDDGITQEYYLHVDLKITEQGRFDFNVEDTYLEGLKLKQQFHEFMKEFKEQLPEDHSSDEQESVAFSSLPVFSFPLYYYASRSFYYELPAGLGVLAIKNMIAERLVADYQLVLPSGDFVDVTPAIKEQGLHFSRFSSPLVSVDKVANTFTVTVACLLDDPADKTSYTAARFTIAKNTVISTDFVKQETQGRVCELED